MNRILKFPEVADLYFASDFHLNHDKDFVWKKRGFSNVKDHDAWILNSLDKLKRNNTPNAILIYLGDFTLKSSIEATREYLKRLPATYYTFGNHESYVSKIYKEGIYNKLNEGFSEIYPFTIDNITFVGTYFQFSYKKQQIIACHYPFYVWDKIQHGTWNICGHSHGSNDLSNHKVLHGKCLDVGVETCKRLVGEAYMSFEQLKKVMDNKVIIQRDHH